MNRNPFKNLYTLDELNKFSLSRLQDICRNEKIKTSSIEMLKSKEELIQVIFRYLGTKKTFCIESYDEVSCMRLEKMLKEDKNQKIEIDVPLKMKLFKDIGSLNDRECKYEITSSHETLGKYVLLIDGMDIIQAIFMLRPYPQKGRYYLSLKKEMMSRSLKIGNSAEMSLCFFAEDVMEEVICTYQDIKKVNTNKMLYYKRFLSELMVEEAPETEEPLMIDYGTSYTTAGIFHKHTGKIERIRFELDEPCDSCVLESKELEGSCKQCEICPSVVGVKSCKENKIEFMFGYEVIQKEKQCGYAAKNSVFYDTKRWIHQYKEKIKVSDMEGNQCEIPRSLILCGFLSYIIKMAERQNQVRYKNIYMTSPVKQKQLSLNMYQEVLPNYNILMEDTIDEAVAVVYHSLSKEMEELDYGPKEPKRVLIIDCGGGTSDMIRCDYIINQSNVTSEVELKIRYAYGNTNFGGDNLTYRILQYLKIRFAEVFAKKQRMLIDEVFERVLEDMYVFVDDFGIDKAYERLNDRYAWAETVIPTCYHRYENNSENRYLKIKGNYYFLWHLAERLKKEFFNKNGLVMLNLQQLFSIEKGKYIYLEHFNLTAFYEKDGMQTYTKCPEIWMTKEEIQLLLKPDIYHLISSFIHTYYETGQLNTLDQIYLSGQTSKIELFREVLKEFIPGKKAKGRGENSCFRKFMCIDGAIFYQEAKKIGRIRTKLTYEPAVVPYFLTVPDFNSREPVKYLITEGMTVDNIYSYISRTIETEEVRFTLLDEDQKKLGNFIHKMNQKELKETSYPHLLERYSVLKQKDMDNIENGEIKLFIYSDNDCWGFFVLEIARIKGILCFREPRYYPFEITGWKMNFFDGLH